MVSGRDSTAITDSPEPAIIKRLTEAADDLNVLIMSENDQAKVASDALWEAAEEIERLHGLLDPTLTFRDMEMKVRDGSLDLRAVMGEESQPVFRFLAGIMLHFVLGEGGPEDLEEPPNYRSGELVLKPAGGFEEIHAAIEIVKPGGKSSHQIRVELEAEVKRLRSGIGAVHSYIENSTDRATGTLDWVAAMVEQLAGDNGCAETPDEAPENGSNDPGGSR